MDMNYGLFQEQTLKLNMTQNLAQAISILQLNMVELTSFIEEIAIENPLLEVETKFYSPLDFGRTKKKRSRKLDEKQPYEALLPDRKQNLYDFLLMQTITFELSDQEKKYLDFLIHNIDESGYLEVDLEDASKILNLPIEIGKQMLRLIHELDPAGIGARNLQECLLIQLERKGQLTLKYRYILTKYFHDFAEKKWKNIQRHVDISLKEIQYLYDLIQKLNPRPGLLYSPEKTEYVIPDIILEKEVDGWHIQIVEDLFLNVRFNDEYYTQLIHEQDSETISYAKDKYRQIQWLKNSIEQRKNTILKIMKGILQKQETYFLDVNATLKPMTMAEIAEKIGVHESTVSRVVKNKYVKTPTGMHALRNLFTNQLSSNYGMNNLSKEAVKKEIQAIIDKEDKTKPFSDNAILSILKDKGIHISRRTITKYRESMNIPSSVKRKRYYV